MISASAVKELIIINMSTIRIFNVFEATECSSSLYDQQFKTFIPAALTKDVIVSLVSIFYRLLLDSFFSAKTFSGSALKKEPVSSISQISAGS